MFMNELNSDAPVLQNAAAPLKHDVEGRFSRKGKNIEVNPQKTAFIENVIVALYITFLLATDFILFSGSGNIEVFRGSFLPIPEISFILLGFLVFSSITVYLLRKISIAKNILASLITFLLVLLLYRQFSMIQQIMSIGGTSVPVYSALGLVCAVVCYMIFYYGNLLARFLYMFAAGVLFVHVCTSYMNQPNLPEFLESYRSEKTGEGKSKRFIYFLFPNLSSYAYLSSIGNSEAVRTKNIMQGFYQKNNFTVYPKAFTEEETFWDNMVRSFNPDSDKKSDKHILKTRLLSEYWRFYNIRHEFINLKDNSLYDFFTKSNYNLSAYKSRDFDMCHTNHQISVDRCIEKINQPVNLYDIRLSTLSKMNILLMEWIASMRIVNNTSSVFAFLSNFMDLTKAPMVGIDYSNLYVVNSIKTFDVLLQNIKEDHGKQAYFVFVDLPSNMYIYNEFCKIKPTDEWYDIANLPWIKNDLRNERQKAYLQQVRCLYGELEYFIQHLRENNLLNSSTIVIQGISSVNDFRSEKNSLFNEDFINNRLVNMAIYDKTLQNRPVDWRFCSTNQLLSSFLSRKNKCSKKMNFSVHEKIVTALNKEIGGLSAEITNDVRKNFEKWFESWMIVNKDKNIEDTVLIEQNNKSVDDGETEKNEDEKDNDTAEEILSDNEDDDFGL